MPDSPSRAVTPPRDALPLRLVCVCLAVVIGFAALDWVGWATGSQRLTRIFMSWPQMTPWTALLLAAAAAAILVQTGHPSPARVRAGRVLAAVVGVTSAVFLAEYATGTSFGLDPGLRTWRRGDWWAWSR